MRVAIRTDASAAIGLGHVQRCLALAHALREAGAQVEFVTRALGVGSAARIEADGHAVHTLPTPGSETPDTDPPHAAWAGVGWHQDAEETLAAVKRVDWLVVDHYAFDARWHEAVAAGLGARIAVADDLADRPLACDLLVDHTYADDHRRKYRGRVADTTPILGGPQYALLGPSYAAAPRHRCRSELKSIGIFMGGADPGGHTAIALKACRASGGFKGAVEIVATRSNAHLAELQRLAARDPAATLSLDLPELSGFFARHDLQIGAGGGATWERCCIGAPTLGMVVADNQRSVLEPLRALGVLRVVEADEASIGQGVSALARDSAGRCELGRRASQLVDGRGAGRVAQHMVRS